VPAFRGTRITADADGTYTLRHKDGGTIDFDSQGQQVGRRDRHGNAVIIERTATTTTATSAGPGGAARTLTWQGRPVSQVTDSAGRTVHYEYDTADRLVAVTDAAGGVTRYAYDSQHRLTTITDARGILFLQNTYDVNSRVCHQQQADGGVFTLHYVMAALATTPESLGLLQEAEAGGAISQGRARPRRRAARR
jgi:YD repeat-containing protein